MLQKYNLKRPCTWFSFFHTFNADICPKIPFLMPFNSIFNLFFPENFKTPKSEITLGVPLTSFHFKNQLQGLQMIKPFKILLNHKNNAYSWVSPSFSCPCALKLEQGASCNLHKSGQWKLNIHRRSLTDRRPAQEIAPPPGSCFRTTAACNFET